MYDSQLHRQDSFSITALLDAYHSPPQCQPPPPFPSMHREADVAVLLKG